MGVGALLFVYLSNTCFQNIQAHTRNYNIIYTQWHAWLTLMVLQGFKKLSIEIDSNVRAVIDSEVNQ